jgi:hypothetical protein
VIEGEITRRLDVLFEVLVPVLRSIARRLLETENPSACEAVNCKVCRIAIAL